MLQLINADLCHEVQTITDKLKQAHTLLQILSEEPSRLMDDVFMKSFGTLRPDLPLLCAEFQVRKRGRPSNFSECDRSEFRMSLMNDIDALIAKARNYDLEPKLFDARVLMKDPNTELKEMEATKKQEIKKLNEELEAITAARCTVIAINRLQQQAATLETAVKDADAPSSSSKKPKKD